MWDADDDTADPPIPGDPDATTDGPRDLLKRLESGGALDRHTDQSHPIPTDQVGPNSTSVPEPGSGVLFIAGLPAFLTIVLTRSRPRR
jgi:hypothetical protein